MARKKSTHYPYKNCKTTTGTGPRGRQTERTDRWINCRKVRCSTKKGSGKQYCYRCDDAEGGASKLVVVRESWKKKYNKEYRKWLSNKRQWTRSTCQKLLARKGLRDKG